MKKIIALLFVFLWLKSSAKEVVDSFPLPYQNLGYIGGGVKNSGGTFLTGTLVPPIYTDTSAANLDPNCRLYAFSIIFTSSDGNFWYRNISISSWIKIATGTISIPTLDQVLGAGNSSTKNAAIDTLKFTGFAAGNGGVTYGLNTYSFLGNGFKFLIGTQILVDNTSEFFVPLGQGTLTYSVNGIAPNDSGNITLPISANYWNLTGTDIINNNTGRVELGVQGGGNFSGALDSTGVSTFGIDNTYIYDGGNGGLLGTDAANGKAWIGDRDDNLNYTNIQLDDQAKTIDVKADNGTTFAFTADAVGQDSLVKVQGGINITRGVRFSGLPNLDTSAYLTTNNSGTTILKHIYSGGGGGSINIGNTDLLLTSNRILGGSDTKNFTLDSINHFVVNTHNGIDFEANYDNSSGSDDIQFNNNRHGNGFLLGSAGDAQLFSVNHNAVILHSADGLNISIDTALKVNGDPGSSGQFLKSQGAVLPPVWATISGSGTVTSFSSGNLSPLFTTTVATSTTTPAQTFALSNTTNYTLFGRASGTGAPSFLTSIDSNWIPTLHSKAYYDGIYQPLENQRLSTTNSVAFQSVNFLPQASAILPPASGNTLFDSAGINYRGSNGITIRLPKSLLTANRADSFPDESGILLLRKDSTIFTTPFYVSQHSGGTPSLTSTYVGYGSGSNILTGSNTLITDGSHLTIGATSLQTAPLYATATSGAIAMFSRNGGFGFASGADVLDAATDGTSMQSEITAQGDGGVSRFWVGAGNTGKKITQLTTFSSTTAGTFAQLPFNLALSSVLCSNDYNGDFEIGSDPLIIMGRPIILGDNIYPTAYGMKRDTFGIEINRQQSLNAAIRGNAQLDVVGKIYSDSLGQSKFTSGIVSFNSNGTLVPSTTITSGVYTPTLTNVTNISSSTANQFTYSRNGNIVTYAGSIQVTTSIAATSEVDFSLPIASAFTSGNDLNGVGQAKTAIGTNVINEADDINDRGECEFIALAISGSGVIFVSGQYTIK